MNWPGFLGPSYVAESPNADCEETINWYLERAESGNPKSKMTLYPTPGYETKVEVAESPCRGIFAQDFAASQRAFFVAGGRLYEFYADWTKLSRGLVARNANPVTMCSNGDAGDQVFITSGDLGYILDMSTNVLTNPLTDVTFGGFLDGFFLALDAETSTFKISELEDGTTWDVTQVQQRNKGPDPWRSMIVAHDRIWLLGEMTSEVWWNEGTSPFPFAPDPAAGLIEQGIEAPFSVAKVGGHPTWLSHNEAGHCMVVTAFSYSPVRISTHAVEWAIENYAIIDDAIGTSYQYKGHNFYQLSFPSAEVTWLYDQTERAWTKLQYWNGDANKYEASRALYHAHTFGAHLVGDRKLGTIYRMAPNLFSDIGGAPIRRLRRTAHSLNEKHDVFYGCLELDLEMGLGLNSGQGSDPMLMLRQSRDGGKTWGAERWVSAGPQGQYRRRARWNRLSSARDAVFELVVTDPFPARISACYLQADTEDESR